MWDEHERLMDALWKERNHELLVIALDETKDGPIRDLALNGFTREEIARLEYKEFNLKMEQH